MSIAIVFFSKLFTTSQSSGQTTKHSILQEGRLRLTHKRLSYRHTGKRPSPESVLVWRSVNRLILLPSTSRLTLCIHWSQTGSTTPRFWVVTRGRHWLVHRLLCSSIATWKVSIPFVLQGITPKQESVWLATMKMIAIGVIRESDLVQVDILSTLLLVEMRQSTPQIMAINSLKQWATFLSYKSKSWDQPATTPYSCHSVFTDRSIFSFNLTRSQISTGTWVTNCSHKHGLILTCRHDVDMFTWGPIVLSLLKQLM